MLREPQNPTERQRWRTRKVRFSVLLNFIRAVQPTLSAAYFEKSPEAAFSALSRSSFEARLSGQFEGSQSRPFRDPAWYAICNTVYAAGCRILLSKADYSSTFAEAQNTSQKYFQNALSVLPEILYQPNDLEVIKAVFLMVGPIRVNDYACTHDQPVRPRRSLPHSISRLYVDMHRRPAGPKPWLASTATGTL